MNSISIIKEIEENYDINSIVSNELSIWQYIRNLIYSQSNPSKKTSTKIKSFYTLIQNHNWGNYSDSKNYKYLVPLEYLIKIELNFIDELIKEKISNYD